MSEAEVSGQGKTDRKGRRALWTVLTSTFDRGLPGLILKVAQAPKRSGWEKCRSHGRARQDRPRVRRSRAPLARERRRTRVCCADRAPREAADARLRDCSTNPTRTDTSEVSARAQREACTACGAAIRRRRSCERTMRERAQRLREGASGKPDD
jgi:hypothetical protein